MVRIRDLVSDLFANQDYGRRSTTKRGERVKSRGEQRIADYLHSRNIAYKYEKTLKTFPIIGEKISRPDFYLPDYDLYIEYWGMVDVPDKRKREEYIRAMKWKMAQYRKHHIKFISLYPSSLRNLDSVFGTKFKEAVGSDLPKGTPTGTGPFCADCGAKNLPIAVFCGYCGKAL